MGQSVCVGRSSGAQLCSAQELANELMLTAGQLQARCMELTGCKLGAASHTELAWQATDPDSSAIANPD